MVSLYFYQLNESSSGLTNKFLVFFFIFRKCPNFYANRICTCIHSQKWSDSVGTFMFFKDQISQMYLQLDDKYDMAMAHIYLPACLTLEQWRVGRTWRWRRSTYPRIRLLALLVEGQLRPKAWWSAGPTPAWASTAARLLQAAPQPARYATQTADPGSVHTHTTNPDPHHHVGTKEQSSRWLGVRGQGSGVRGQRSEVRSHGQSFYTCHPRYKSHTITFFVQKCQICLFICKNHNFTFDFNIFSCEWKCPSVKKNVHSMFIFSRHWLNTNYTWPAGVKLWSNTYVIYSKCAEGDMYSRHCVWYCHPCSLF